MDVISLSKASKALRNIQNLNDQVVAPLAESRFPTVDARLDWLEGQTAKVLVEGSKQLDISQGVLENTELVNGKIQLKKVGTTGSGYTNDVIPKLTSNSSGSIVVSASTIGSANTDAWYAFNDTVDAGWVTLSGTKTGWLKIDFGSGNSKLIQKYTVTTHSTQPARSPKSWTFEASNTGSFSGEQVTLDAQNNITSWTAGETKTFTIFNNSSYRYYRINVSANNGDTSYLSIGEMELMESVIQNQYATSGTYESPIIDLGEGWHETKLVDVVKQINTGNSDSLMEVSTSTDGVTFSPYASLANQQTRYVKIRATLSATPIANPMTTVQYDQSPKTKVTLNDYSDASGDLKLKTSFIYTMSSLTQDTDGQIIKATIPKNQFQTISKLEVK